MVYQIFMDYFMWKFDTNNLQLWFQVFISNTNNDETDLTQIGH